MIPSRQCTTLCLVPAAIAAVACRGASPIAVTLETTEGPVHCELDASRAPRAIELFTGLATGRAAWKDPKTREWTHRPMYENLTFHRAIPHVMVQSGCPVGDSSGNPGYRIAAEPSTDDGARLARPGALFLARYTPPPGRTDPDPPPPGHVHGSQFVVALTDMSHLASHVTVLGRCGDLETVERISEHAERVRLLRVEVR